MRDAIARRAPAESDLGAAPDLGAALDRMRRLASARLAAIACGAEAIPARLEQSIRHSLLAPAKRIRAALVMTAAEHWGVNPEAALDAACAVEMVHAASLVLDDLPAMDDAHWRRGVAANHRVYGESTAILAAIGLLSRAFGAVAEDKKLTPDQRVKITERLSAAIGPAGLVAGQEIDLNGAAEKARLEGLERMYAGKTGALFSVSAEIGAILGGADAACFSAMTSYGARLGIAFQTLDDVLDAVGSQQSAGKDVRKDVTRQTLVTLLGVAEAERQAHGHIEAAIAAVRNCGAGEPLAAFARYMTQAMQVKLFEARQPAAAGE